MLNQAATDLTTDSALESELSEGLSRDEAFVARAEALRLRQEWLHDVDLRQYVSEPCRRYRYRRRIYWLDGESRKIFVEGVRRDGGVVTVGCYEAVLDAAKLKADQDPKRLPAGTDALPPSLRAKLSADEGAVHQLHDIFSLGYFEKRRNDRIKYTTRVVIIGEGQLLTGRTRDISETGLRVRTTSPGGYQADDVVKIKFPDIPELKDQLVAYRVVRIVRKLNDFFFALRCEEGSANPLADFLRGLGALQEDNGDGKLLIDAEDASLTAESLLAERHYMHSAASIPFFLARDGMRGVRIKAIFFNGVNEQSLSAFNTATGENRLAETIGRRHLRHFMKMANVDGQVAAMLAVWRSPDGRELRTLMDLSCRTDADWYASLAKHRNEDGFRAFKVVARRVRRPDSHRLVRELEPLAAVSPEDAEQLLRDSSSLIALGALMDFTAEVRGWNLRPYESATPAAPHRDADEPEKRRGGKPELLPIDFVERTRSKERYLLQVHVIVEMQGRSVQALTGDISLTGMSIFLPDDAPRVAPGVLVRVTLSGLTENAGLLARLRGSFERVPYSVATTEPGDETLVRLRLQEPDRQRGFIRALSIFLEKQQSTLRVERSHSLQAAASRMYSSFFVEAATALPVLYFRAKGSESPSAKVGLNQKPGPLASFFETADGKFDFSAITSPARTARLWQQMEQCGRAEMDVFLVKERVPNQARYKITALADYEFRGRLERGAFLDYALGKDIRIIRIVMLPPRVPSAPELALAVDRLETYSKRHAAKLRQDYEGLVAVGDVVDITANFNELRYMVP